jgi:hypothetical protein
MCRGSSVRRRLPLLLPFLLPLYLSAQTPPDVITFINGEKMSGQLRGATNTGVIFRSEMVGDVVVDWSRIQDLHSATGFAALMRGQANASAQPVPNNAPAIVVQPSAPPASEPRVVAVAPAPVPAPEPPSPPVATARRAEPPPPPAPPAATPPVPAPSDSQTASAAWFGHRLFSGWKGGATLGFALTEATQNNLSLNAAVNLARLTPSGKDAWPLRTRTYFNFNVLYNKLTQEGDLTYFDPVSRMLVLPGAFSKTYLIHADLVRDYFIFPRVFVFGGATFDHNYAQSLELLQSYGGGMGAVLYHTKSTELDIRGGVGYTGQRYLDFPPLDRKLVGSRFEETFQHRFANGITFSEEAGVRPSWNYSQSIFAGGTASLNIPVYRRLGLNLSSFDFWNNDPPPMFQKNIFQVTAGVNYAF